MFKHGLAVHGVAVSLFWCLSANARADMDYFDQGIDYWHAGDPPRSPKHDASHAAEKRPAGFDWQRYLDPKNDEFFREGDYTPPATCMEVARNPSNENLRNWFAYVGAKNAVAARLGERMQAFTQAKAPREANVERPAKPAVAEAAPAAINTSRFLIRFYFDSQCPHCRRMALEIEKLRQLGFQIEGRQVDEDAPPARPPLAVPIQYATGDELHRLGIQSVPLLLIADRDGKAVYRVPGFQSAETVLRALPGGSD